MPTLHANGNELYYEVSGTGDPLILIPGIGHSMRFWFLQIPALQQEFQLILFDPRGVGRSDHPLQPYAIDDEVEDLRLLIRELGLQSSHVLGVSRGGYVAQELAIQHPDLVDRLVLAVTHQGGPEYLEATAQTWTEMFNVIGLSPEQIVQKGLRLVTTDDFFFSNQVLVNQIVHMSLTDPQPFHSFQLQFESARRFDSRGRAGRITAQTLVIAGESDRLVPSTMASRLAGTIPGAIFKEIKNAAHYVFIEQAELFNREVIGFLKEA